MQTAVWLFPSGGLFWMQELETVVLQKETVCDMECFFYLFVFIEFLVVF